MFTQRRYACIRQADRTDCGPAALATVALHHGMRLSRERMRDLAGTDRAGTNLLGVMKAGERLGFQCRAVKGDYDGLLTVPLPAIAHVKTDEGLGHYVVLHRVDKDRAVVADPARGVEILGRAAFAEKWSGYLLLLTPSTRFTVDRTRAFSPTRRLLELLVAHRSAVLEGFACAVLMTLLGISTSYFIQHLVDSVLARGEGRFLDALGLGMVLIILFRTLFGALRQYLMAYVARQTGIKLIADYSRHILHLPMRFFEMRQVGDILARVNDAAKVREVIGGVTLTVLVDGTMVLITIFVLWLYDSALALVATAFVPVMVLSVALHHPFARKRAADAMDGSGKLSGHLVEDVSGVETIKALGVERARAEEGEDHCVRVMQSAFSLQKLGVSSGGAATFAMGLAGVVILWYGGHRVMSGAVSIGQLMFFHSLLAYMLQPLERLASVNLQVQDALVAVDRLYQIMDLDAEQGPAVEKSAFPGISRGIELRNVDFEYGTRGKVVQGIDLDIPAGTKVALLGESGSGKTTLLKLLMRFYEPTCGQVLIDGVDARDLDLASLRSRIGLVPQEPYIFTGTIRDNIAMARPGASMAELIDAVRAAGLEETIARMPERFETVIGERGANLSGGQRQRLAIARALLKKPDLLIFDEATSHLDTATERAIQETLRVALAGKTVVLVAHRLSTVRDADLIYVLQKGRIAERGSHAQLLAAGGAYAALWRAQSLDAEPGDLRTRPKLMAGVAHAD